MKRRERPKPGVVAYLDSSLAVENAIRSNVDVSPNPDSSRQDRSVIYTAEIANLHVPREELDTARYPDMPPCLDTESRKLLWRKDHAALANTGIFLRSG